MPNWIQSGSIYYVQPTEPEMTREERDAYLDELLAMLHAKLEAAKLKFEQRETGMTA